MGAATIFLSAALFFACTSSPTVTNQVSKEFDLPSFFQHEIKRLSSANREVIKTVSTGDSSETKTIQQIDWKKELAAFSSVDVNKAVYAGEIRKDSSDHIVTLYLDNPDADISKVRIHYDKQNEPQEIIIHKNIHNLLYHTIEILSYKKDHNYSIEKQQDVWLLGTNHYTIKGSFSN